MKIIRSLILLGVLLVFNGSTLIAQEGAPVRMDMPVGGFEFANQTTSTAIPFKLADNLIVIQVELNRTTLNLILDTGMPFDGALLFGSDKVDAAQLTFTSKMPVGGVDGNPILSDVSLGATLKVPNLTLTNQMIVAIPRDATRSRQFEGVDGIIGFSLFNHLIVSINYERQYMIISQPGTVDLAKAGQAVPVDIRDNRIFLKADVKLESGAIVPGEFVVDTGNRNALMLNAGNNNALVLPARNLPYFAASLTGKAQWKMGRIAGFNLGGFQLENVLASFNDGNSGTSPWEKEGNLGNQILGRFHLTFNLPGNQIYIAKNGLFGESFDFNLAGLQVERAEDLNLTICHVIPGSPAEKAGLLTGDKILAVNKKSAAQLSRSEFEEKIDKNGKKVSVVLERSGEKFSVNMKLERFI
ncbi:MAG: PDZ domain-containing protein [Candidatus Neomarinimicrobiota bacterium]